MRIATQADPALPDDGALAGVAIIYPPCSTLLREGAWARLASFRAFPTFSLVLSVNRRALLAWALVLGWLSLVLIASGDGFSFSRSSRILRPLLEWLFPALPEEQMWRIVTAIRKLAHVAEYFVLALLAWRAWRLTGLARGARFTWPRLAAIAFGFTVACAALDEFRQSLTQTRQGSVWDVALDAVGAALGLLFLWLIHVWRSRRAKTPLAAAERSTPAPDGRVIS